MSEVILITSGKGGVGKSTLAAALGRALAARRRRTVLIDMDMGLRSLDMMLGLEHKVVYDLADVAEGMCRVRQALVKSPQMEDLWLLSAAQTRGGDALTPRGMELVVLQLRDRFDMILIDSPAGVGRGFHNAAGCADRALIVATPDPIALRDAERVVGLLERRGVRADGVILNRMLPRDMEDADVGPRAFEERLRLPIIGLVPEEPRLKRRLDVHTNADPGLPPASRAADRIARRVLGEAVALEPVVRPTLLQRLYLALKDQ
ncbi:MAG: septum site-determining protein MinD [Christensenellaceae bacterium]|nr:septum site-determining protein MinD [Christensenellaceae bacterium]MEA5064985.1 septum site-determining protein MinD [Eubacteriales bacterium]MEA5067979.1 septum site-determining protein MinD [Christensenellaceae bacterium]